MLDSSADGAAVSFEWVSRFTDRDVSDMIALLNAVVRTTGTNGYSRELTAEEGRKLASGVGYAIQRGEVAQLLVRDRSGRVVGIATLQSPKQPDRHHVIEVSRVAVLPECRGRFLIKAWKEVLCRAEELGASLISIDVSEDGPVRLWERLGFTTWGVMKDYARVGARRLDGYYMVVYVHDAWARLGRGSETCPADLPHRARARPGEGPVGPDV
jgi:ribosomal protein S18 acetylase RimI-like enzyme